MRRLIVFLICTMLLSVSLFAQQKDTTYVKGLYSGGVEGELNTVIQDAVNSGSLNGKVFKLNPYDWYVLTGQIEVPIGQTLELVAPAPSTTQPSAPPQIRRRMW